MTWSEHIALATIFFVIAGDRPTRIERVVLYASGAVFGLLGLVEALAVHLGVVTP